MLSNDFLIIQKEPLISMQETPMECLHFTKLANMDTQMLSNCSSCMQRLEASKSQTLVIIGRFQKKLRTSLKSIIKLLLSGGAWTK